jgi:FkbM family methyltransferase
MAGWKAYLHAVRAALRRAGVDVRRYDALRDDFARRTRLLAHHRVDVVFDIGANTGQYAEQLRSEGFAGSIVSFEPLSAAFRQLEERCADDPRWQCFRLGLGDDRAELELHIAGNSFSSSVLPMQARHAEASPESAYVGTERVPIDTLDHFVSDNPGLLGERTLLKIDAQGYERFILAGASATLPRVIGLQLEMSLVELYEGEQLMHDMVNGLRDKGFALESLEGGWFDPKTGQQLQVDGLFFRPTTETK